MAEYHRKIELQSPDDLQYLIDNVRRAAHERIDKDLPPIEGEDQMRTRVEELVNAYITTVFQNASENITINGLSPNSAVLDKILHSSGSSSGRVVEEHEAFDPRLWERAKDLARKEEDLVEEIAALRRKVPGLVVEGVRKSYKEGVDGDDEIMKKVGERLSEKDGDREGLSVGALERQDAVEGAWGRGVEGLGRLKMGMPEMVARKEKAERVEAYILAPEKK